MHAAQARREVFFREPELPADLGGLGQVFVELGFPELARQAVHVGHERALAVAGHDHALVLEIEIGTFDGDDADVEGSRKCPD